MFQMFLFFRNKHNIVFLLNFCNTENVYNYLLFFCNSWQTLVYRIEVTHMTSEQHKHSVSYNSNQSINLINITKSIHVQRITGINCEHLSAHFLFLPSPFCLTIDLKQNQSSLFIVTHRSSGRHNIHKIP